MGIFDVIVLAVSCLTLPGMPADCLSGIESGQIAGAFSAKAQSGPVFSGEAVDVILTAEAALAWDMASNTVMYEKKAGERRPIASLTKLFSTLAIRENVSDVEVVTIGEDAARAQRLGANIRLPAGQHALASDLLAAALIASANDAMAALAAHTSGSEEEFVTYANNFVASAGFTDTRLANATGLDEGEQYSTAQDVRRALMRAYQDPVLKTYLSAEAGVLTTQEGVVRRYVTTNKLAGTYVTVLAAKTGYTTRAGENLALIAQGENGQEIGAVILGSTDRFQDMKVLLEWVQRNYSWPH